MRRFATFLCFLSIAGAYACTASQPSIEASSQAPLEENETCDGLPRLENVKTPPGVCAQPSPGYTGELGTLSGRPFTAKTARNSPPHRRSSCPSTPRRSD